MSSAKSLLARKPFLVEQGQGTSEFLGFVGQVLAKVEVAV